MDELEAIVGAYASGLFPMDEAGHAELPWWTVDPRAVFALDPESRAATRRAVRRSLRAAGPGWRLVVDGDLEAVLEACARPRSAGDGVWLTPRMRRLYRRLNEAGLAHSFELRRDGELGAGIVAVTIGRAAMLESMFHRVPHAGNVLLVTTLDALAGSGFRLCDIQTPTDHTLRLGAQLIPRAEYEERLRAALAA